MLLGGSPQPERLGVPALLPARISVFPGYVRGPPGAPGEVACRTWRRGTPGVDVSCAPVKQPNEGRRAGTSVPRTHSCRMGGPQMDGWRWRLLV